MLGVRTARTEKAFERDHEILLESARSVGFVSFKAHCDRWELLVDPDGAEQGADDDHAAREVHLSRSFGGMWFGKMTLDPISGEIVNTTLQLIERELFEADWAAAKERLGREPTILELERTPAQRRADALVEMATRARTAPADGRRPAPLFNVLVGYETFAGPLLELFNRTVHHAWHRRSLAHRSRHRARRLRLPVPCARCRRHPPLLHRCAAPSHRGARPHLLPSELRRASAVPADRPHPGVQQGRSHHPEQRPARLRLPQPLAQQPPRPRVGPGHPRPRRPHRRPRPTRLTWWRAARMGQREEVGDGG